MIFGADYRMAQTSFSNATFTFGNVTLSAARFYGLIITLAISVGLWIFCRKQRPGASSAPPVRIATPLL